MRGGSWGAPCPVLAWPASTASTVRRGCSCSPLVKQPSSRDGQMKFDFESYTQGITTWNPPWASREEMSYNVFSMHFLDPLVMWQCTLRIDTCLLWLGFLKDHYNIYFLHVYCVPGITLHILKALPPQAKWQVHWGYQRFKQQVQRSHCKFLQGLNPCLYPFITHLPPRYMPSSSRRTTHIISG